MCFSVTSAVSEAYGGHAWTDEVEEVLFEAAETLVTHDEISATRRHVSRLKYADKMHTLSA